MGIRAALVLIALTSFGYTGHGAAQEPALIPQPRIPPSPDVERLLSRARAALGGVDRLSAVKSLIVEGSRTREPESAEPEADPFGFKMLLPDRYQSSIRGFHHTIDGSGFWMDEPPAGIAITQDIRVTAERSTRWNFIHMCLIFLLKAPDTVQTDVRYVGTPAWDTGKREWIEMTAAGYKFRVGFDRSNGLPSVVRTDSSLGERVETLSGHKDIDGILFPFTIDESSGNGMYHSVTKIATIKVNTGVSATDFRKE